MLLTSADHTAKVLFLFHAELQRNGKTASQKIIFHIENTISSQYPTWMTYKIFGTVK